MQWYSSFKPLLHFWLLKQINAVCSIHPSFPHIEPQCVTYPEDYAIFPLTENYITGHLNSHTMEIIQCPPRYSVQQVYWHRPTRETHKFRPWQDSPTSDAFQNILTFLSALTFHAYIWVVTYIWFPKPNKKNSEVKITNSTPKFLSVFNAICTIMLNTKWKKNHRIYLIPVM